MSSRRIAVLALTGALLAGGAGAAIATVTGGDDKKAEDAILTDAAKRLNVAPDKLRDALAAAEGAQLDQAVKDGKLTQKQADAIKARRQKSGRVLGGGPGGPGPGFLRGGPGFGPHHGAAGALFPDLAKALGITGTQLRDQLRAGKSIADIAKAQGKSLDDVRTAMKADAKTKADKAVADGDITQAQADELLSHLDDALSHLGDARPAFRLHGHRGRGPVPDLRRGGFEHGSQGAPDLGPAGGVPS
ncbi:MAG: hypothetical protein QOD69_1593 [Solirubrobacteraceae bacterium]|nr:hypothetical protein [Solirubrobacteraceae bacterium]